MFVFSCEFLSLFVSQVKGVVLKSGTVLEADVVIAGIGNNIILIHAINPTSTTLLLLQCNGPII